MVQRYEGRVCPIHIHVEWELQDLGNNVPATDKELKRVSHGENRRRKDGKGNIAAKRVSSLNSNYAVKIKEHLTQKSVGRLGVNCLPTDKGILNYSHI